MTEPGPRPARTPARAGVFVWALAAAAIASLLAGCAAPQATALRAQTAAVSPRTVQLDVPFFAQEEYQCGPAALAMVLRTTGVEATPEALVPQVYLPAREGALQPEMLATARRAGRLAVVLPPRLDALLAEVAAGRPVIVLQNLSLPVFPRWHYAVVIGYDIEADTLLLHSGTTARLRLPLDTFEHTWARSGHWAMTASRPDDLPASATVDALLAAAVALERVDAAAARRSYAALVKRAPDSYGAWFGLGNTAAAAAEHGAAREAFRRATQLRPDAADAWHNLALMLLRDGQRDAAWEAIGRAIALGGPRLDRYRESQRLIERAPR